MRFCVVVFYVQRESEHMELSEAEIYLALKREQDEALAELYANAEYDFY